MPTKRFCGDCEKFRTVDCERSWSVGLAAKGKDGGTYWLQNHRDHVSRCMSYTEVAEPKYSLLYEEELRNESLKYGGKIIWS